MVRPENNIGFNAFVMALNVVLMVGVGAAMIAAIAPVVA